MSVAIIAAIAAGGALILVTIIITICKISKKKNMPTKNTPQ